MILYRSLVKNLKEKINRRKAIINNFMYILFNEKSKTSQIQCTEQTEMRNNQDGVLD